MSARAASRAAAVRRGVGVFPDLPRGLVEVGGGDRVRWLNGMLTVDVTALAPGAPRSGAYALLLSPKGRILADLQVIARPEHFWLDTEAVQLPGLIARLERYVIADDVTLRDVSGDHAHVGIEGPGAPALVEALTGAAAPALLPDAGCDVEIAGVPLVLAAFGWSGEPAFQLILPAAARETVTRAIRAAGGDALVEGDAATLEVLRIEAGIPRVGAELDEEVFPAEARLVARAVSLTKGCFTGQEIVARIESRGQVNHHLVALRFDGDAAPEAGAELALADGRRVGEVTSACVSSRGPIGLGYVRLPHDAPGSELRCGARGVRVAALPQAGATPR